MRVMVLGATGFIGRRLMRWLAALGHEAVGVARRPSAEDPAVLALDRGEPAAIAAAASRHGTEAVIDLLAMTLPATKPLVDALAGRVGRYVLASSGDVYRQYGAIYRLEEEPAPARQLAEDAPLRTRLFPYRTEPRRTQGPDAWMDDYDKIPIERMVAGRGDLTSTILRLPMVYGPGDRQHRFAWAIRPMLAGAPAIEIDAEWAVWRSTYGYVDDVAAGLALAATHPSAGGVFNLGAAEAPDHAHWAERFAAALNWTGVIRLVPRERAAGALRTRLDALDLKLRLVTDTAKIRTRLGYREPTDPGDAIARTIADEAARGGG